MAAAGVGRVSDRLQLGEHAARHEQGAVQEAHLDERKDASVEDGARVEDGHLARADACRARLHPEEAEQLVALVAADRVAEIAGRRVQERDGRIRGDSGEVEERKREQRREEQPDHEPDRPGQDLRRGLASEFALELGDRRGGASAEHPAHHVADARPDDYPDEESRGGPRAEARRDLPAGHGEDRDHDEPDELDQQPVRAAATGRRFDGDRVERRQRVLLAWRVGRSGAGP